MHIFQMIFIVHTFGMYLIVWQRPLYGLYVVDSSHVVSFSLNSSIVISSTDNIYSSNSSDLLWKPSSSTSRNLVIFSLKPLRAQTVKDGRASSSFFCVSWEVMVCLPMNCLKIIKLLPTNPARQNNKVAALMTTQNFLGRSFWSKSIQNASKRMFKS